MRLFLITAALLTLLIPAGRASPVTLTEKDGGKEVVLKKGEYLQIRLPVNNTTGYSWDVSCTDFTVLSSKKIFGQQSYVVMGKVGAGGNESWVFEALQGGSTKLTFSYARPWEKGVAPAKVIFWNVTVRP